MPVLAIMPRTMVSLVQPLSSRELYTFVLQPYLEGVERLKRAWDGIDFHSLSRTAFSWKERTVFLISGICLTFFPFINTIIWLSWQTFGNPEILSDPYIPPYSPAPVPIQPKELPVVPSNQIQKTPQIHPIQPLKLPETETFSFLESSKNFHAETKWKLEHSPNGIQVNVESEKTRTVAKYDKKGWIQEYHCYEPNAELHGCLLPNRQLKIQAHRGTRIEEREYKLEKDLPWVQQSTIGMKQFIQNPNQKSFRFYSIRPDNLDLVEVVARKLGEETVPGHGLLIHVEVKMDHYFYRYLREGEMWFDPKTGILRKLIDSGRFMDKVLSLIHISEPTRPY